MGYYVQIIDGELCIHKDKLDAAYKALCDLNKRDDLKNGRFPKNHFSWMDANYPETCKDARAVFKALGFDTDITAERHLVINGYDSKTGDEHHFLDVIAPFCHEGDYLVWQGESSDIWRNIVKDGKLVTQEGRIVFDED